MSLIGKTASFLQIKGETSSDFAKSLDLWYADGSVVLVADKTGFRVHTSILASHCEVFKDMVAIPQPASPDSDGSETYEGCPMLKMQDSPMDLYHFLKSLYDFSYFRPGARNKFAVAAAVLRLSTKYVAPVLRRQAIDILSTAYPSSYDNWLLRDEKRLVPPIRNELSMMVVLAEQTDTRVLLPSALYAAARQPLTESLQQLHSLQLGEFAKVDILNRFLLGREKVLQELQKDVLAFLHSGFHRGNCQNTGSDNSKLLEAAQKALLRLTYEEPYYLWCIDHPGEVGSSISLCENCTKLVKEHIENATKAIWERLPTIFGLPEWGVLKADESSA